MYLSHIEDLYEKVKKKFLKCQTRNSLELLIIGKPVVIKLPSKP